MCGLIAINCKNEERVTNRNNFLSKFDSEFIFDLIHHRGPDSKGESNSKNSRIFHSRLKIVGDDTSGSQPIVSWDGNVQLVFNGEIYNWKELTKLLPELENRILAENSDSRLLVELLAKFPPRKIISKLRGMYSFVYLKDSKMYAVRDKFGQKPLFLFKNNEITLISSEIHPLIEILKSLNIELKISRESTRHFLLTGYCKVGTTLYSEIMSLFPNEVIEVDCEDNSIVRNEESFDFDTNLVLQSRNLEELLILSIEEQLIADVSVGVWLSGGVDSSTIACVAKKELGYTGLTLSVAFPENSSLSESRFSNQVAQKLGLEHLRFDMTLSEAEEVISAYEDSGLETLGDPSVLATLFLARETRKYCTVALSGDGADELFLGYSRHRMALNSRRSNFNRLARNYFDIHFPTFPKSLSQGELGNLDYVHWFQTTNTQSASRLIQEQDRNSYLPQNILVKSDRCSMAFSLEVRTPFLDERIANLAYSLNQYNLISGSIGKLPVKDILRKHMPEDLVYRTKQGFTPPLDLWLRTSLFSWADNLLTNTPWESVEMSSNAVRTLWSEFVSQKNNDYFYVWVLINISIAVKRIL